jgi:glycosyltransferase involved in cell wall biosynthesis
MDICLSMIVKDEAGVIERCLRSVRPFIHAWAIVDTGSTDGTQDLIRNALGDLPGQLAEHPWVDFATNRNQALQLARGLGTYAMFIDADDTLDVVDPRVLESLDADSYAVEILTRGVLSCGPFLARLTLPWTWAGVLHETLECAREPLVEKRLPGARLLRHDDGARSRAGLQAKYARDAELLREALRADPHNSRYVLYLGHSLREARQWPAAIEAYERRAQMGGWAEEVYIAKLMVATLRQHIGAPDADVVAAYLDAFHFRPQRAEAPAQLARYHLEHGRHDLARDFARIACATPPPTDTLLVNTNAYGWRPWDDLAIALFELKDMEGCAEAFRHILGDHQLPPTERERVEKNLRRVTGRSDCG